ncbi:Hypothetical protein MexAM1_META2p0060 (plasmid) [Methylorubrum extorquens AM1]|uniref:Uncharacterized protein n=1 Tax=Methylorubrum extorquens (strain ATCC 14718 / DSM 1338 / JCM 2805 / NCIMB 9133 / AM1) TaxID=272630 RepID=C5B3G5_METEA|nr:Hypothetical protein MexAM1_META2p0060 [Methylorubrum extorquens AM1]
MGVPWLRSSSIGCGHFMMHEVDACSQQEGMAQLRYDHFMRQGTILSLPTHIRERDPEQGRWRWQAEKT